LLPSHVSSLAEAVTTRHRDQLGTNVGVIARSIFTIANSLCYGRKEMFPLCLALRQANAMASKRAAHGSSLMVNVFVQSPGGAFLAVAMTPYYCFYQRRNRNNSLQCSWPSSAQFMSGSACKLALAHTEWTVALGFFGAAMVGLWVTPWIVPAAYVVHGFWDYAHHQNSRLAPIPSWHPPFCAVLDLGGSGDFDHYLGSACLNNHVPQIMLSK
jgi:hypothetical protein